MKSAKQRSYLDKKEVEDSEMSRRIIEIPADQWYQIESMLTAPAKVIPAVQEISKYQPK